MDLQYEISLDEGVTTKGPFSFDQIKQMYLGNRIPEDFMIRQTASNAFMRFTEVSPELVRERSMSEARMKVLIDRSEKEAITEERQGILIGFAWLISGAGTATFLLLSADANPSGRRIVSSIVLAVTGLIKFLASLKSTVERHQESKNTGSSNVHEA
jgi:hypothetical protein